MAFVLGVLLLIATIATEVAKDWFGFTMPLYVKYIALSGSCVAFIYDHFTSQEFEIRIETGDWTQTDDGQCFTIPNRKHRKGINATCTVYKENGTKRQPVTTGLEYSDNGDIVVCVSIAQPFVAVVS